MRPLRQRRAARHGDARRRSGRWWQCPCPHPRGRRRPPGRGRHPGGMVNGPALCLELAAAGLHVAMAAGSVLSTTYFANPRHVARYIGLVAAAFGSALIAALVVLLRHPAPWTGSPGASAVRGGSAPHRTCAHFTTIATIVTATPTQGPTAMNHQRQPRSPGGGEAAGGAAAPSSFGGGGGFGCAITIVGVPSGDRARGVGGRRHRADSARRPPNPRPRAIAPPRVFFSPHAWVRRRPAPIEGTGPPGRPGRGGRSRQHRSRRKAAPCPAPPPPSSSHKRHRGGPRT